MSGSPPSPTPSAQRAPSTASPTTPSTSSSRASPIEAASSPRSVAPHEGPMDAAGLAESVDGFEEHHGGRRPPFPRALGKPANDRRFPTASTGRGGGQLNFRRACFADSDRLEPTRHATDPGGMLLK